MEEPPQSIQQSANDIFSRLQVGFLKQVKYLQYLKFMMFFLILTSSILLILSQKAYNLTSALPAKAILLTSFISIIGAFLGLYGSFRSLKELEQSQETPGGFKYTVVGFYFLFGSMVMYLVFGTRVLFYQEKILVYLKTYYYTDPNLWNENFEGASLEEIQGLSVAYLTSIGIICYVSVFLILLTVYLLFVLSVSFKVLHTVLEVINYIILFLGQIVLQYGYNWFQKKQEKEISELIDKGLPVTLIITGALIFVSMLVGLYTLINERFRLIKGSVFLCLVLMVISSVTSSATFKNGAQVQDYSQTSSLDLMSKLHEEYLSKLGCNQKYKEISRSEEELDCNKTEIRYIWDKSATPLFGCLNTVCVNPIIHDLTSHSDYLGLTLISIVCLLALNIAGFLYLYRSLEQNQSSGEWKVGLFRVLGLFIAIVNIQFVMSYWNFNPYSSSFSDAKVVVQNATTIDQKYFQTGFCQYLPQFQVQTENREIQVWSQTGLFYYSKEYTERISFQVDEQFKEFQKQAVFCPKCEWLDSYFTVDTWQKTNSSDGTVDSTQVWIPTSSPEKQILKGSVYDQSIPVKASISVQKGECLSFTKKHHHNYHFHFPVSEYYLPYLIQLTYYIPSLYSAKRVQKVGGFPFTSYQLPPVILPQIFFSNSTLEVVIKNQRSWNNIEGEIQIRKGYNNFTGPVEKVYKNVSELEIQIQSGVYSIKVRSAGHKNFHYELSVEGSSYYYKAFPLVSNTIGDNQLKVLLSWDALLDLDLKSLFVLDDSYVCDVSFANSACGGSRFLSSQQKSQVLSIENIGDYQYLVYVKQFVKDYIDLGIISSNLKIDLYIKSQKDPILSLYGNRQYQQRKDNIEETRIWLGFCLKGSQGISSLTPLQQYVSIEYNLSSVCQSVFGPYSPYNPTTFNQLKVKKTLPKIPEKIIHIK